MSYNGWENKATWLVNLYFDTTLNDYFDAFYEHYIWREHDNNLLDADKFDRHAFVSEFATYLEDHIWDLMFESFQFKGTPGHNLLGDLLSTVHIDWHEIADHLADGTEERNNKLIEICIKQQEEDNDGEANPNATGD